MIYSSKKLENVMIEDGTDELSELIKNNYINIIFGDFNETVLTDIEESFNIPKNPDNPSIYIYIRNKYIDGSDGKPIEHPCTIKFIKNDVYTHNGDKGVPFEIEPDVKLGVDYKINKRDEKYVIDFIKHNRQDILRYWNAEDTEAGRRKMAKIQKRMCKKYGVKLNEKNK